MKIAIYGREIEKKDHGFISELFEFLSKESISYIIEEKYRKKLSQFQNVENIVGFSNPEDLLAFETNYIISLGGDGTLLDTLDYTKQTKLPVMGINLGRLGFLSSVHIEEAFTAIRLLQLGQYKIESRTMLELKSESHFFKGKNYALNDFTIHKSDTGSMVEIDTYFNGEFFNTYWADGLIVSTGTGSTAYSLSCGGPIMFPDSKSFAVTPVAPHNLSIRPIVISDDTVVSFNVRGRGNTHLISLDARYEVCEYGKTLAIQKSTHNFRLIKLDSQNFINTLREKLGWGFDSRNG
ncbi:MAG: NAD kinase [Bacteroidetes bacterium]|nr:NAD kinase [Bacteroidota bacterium]